MMLVAGLSVLIAIFAIGNITMDYCGRRRGIYLTKPVPMVLIICLALLSTQGMSSGYRWAVLLGLLFSLVGDTMLMLPEDQFLPGLASFLVAHLCYIVAFSRGVALFTSYLLPVLLLTVALGVFLRLRPHLGSMTIPVLLYMLVISAMVWRAGERWLQAPNIGALTAFVGALLFLISDAALAVERFVGPFRIAKALVLGTYFCAQWLIALST